VRDDLSSTDRSAVLAWLRDLVVDADALSERLNRARPLETPDDAPGVNKLRVYPTGTGSEAWGVDRDGEHLVNVRLAIDATGRGIYQITNPDRPDAEVSSALVASGAFTFDVWDRAAVRKVLADIVRAHAPGAATATIEIKHPTL
jgi:hypothetical protein